MKNQKIWDNLNTLNLNACGITVIGLGYLLDAFMPKLKKLNILANNFSKIEKTKQIVNQLRSKYIQVSYRTQKEREKEKVRKIKYTN